MALPSAIIQRGTRAAQPSAASVAAGVIYCVTNEGNILERSTGAAWEAFSPTGSGNVTASGTLTANQLLIGGGTTVAAALGSLGTTTTLLHGNAAGAPTYAAVALAADVSGDLPLANLAPSSAASRLLGRGDSGAGDYQEITVGANLTMTGTTLAATASGGALNTVGQFDLVNSAAETSVYSFSVTANTLATTRALRLTLFGDYLNNSGAGRTFTLRIKYGATTLYDDTTGSLTASAVRRAQQFVIHLGNTGTTNAQFLSWDWLLSNVAATTAGLGDLATAVFGNNQGGGSAAEDSTTTLTFNVTIQHSVADANLSWRRQCGTLELL